MLLLVSLSFTIWYNKSFTIWYVKDLFLLSLQNLMCFLVYHAIRSLSSNTNISSTQKLNNYGSCSIYFFNFGALFFISLFAKQKKSIEIFIKFRKTGTKKKWLITFFFQNIFYWWFSLVASFLLIFLLCVVCCCCSELGAKERWNDFLFLCCASLSFWLYYYII